MENKIKYFGVKNFKSFKGEHWFNLKNITFLIGQNSSGKSSLINALRIANSTQDDSSELSDIGIRENWINDLSLSENVEFSKGVDTNVDFLNNRFYFFESYYPNKSKFYPNGKVFKKFADFSDYDIHSSDFEITPFEFKDHLFKDVSLKKYIDKLDLRNYYDKIEELLKERNKALDDLIFYKIKSANERKLWVEEKERIDDEENLFSSSFPIEYGQTIFNKPYHIFKFIIDFIVENYDLDVENEEFKIKGFYTKLKEKENFQICVNRIDNESIENIQLEPLKKLLTKLVEFNEIIPSIFKSTDIFKSTYVFFFKTDAEQIKYEESPHIKLSYISNKKNHLDYFSLHKFNPEILKREAFQDKLEFVNKYLNFFNIGEKIYFQEIQVRNNREIEVYIIKNGISKKLYTYFGFGVQLLLPLLMEILFTDSEVLLIEEPESNLHPALQSKLAVFFVELANKYNKQIIIETHSEYIIRKMQYLVANHYKKNTNQLPTIGSDEVNIYYFNDPVVQTKNEEPYTYEIKFNENGLLDKDFGSGFIDEASNLTIDLLRISNFN